MRFREFRRLHSTVRAEPVRHVSGHRLESTVISRAIDLACVFYYKRVLCLQRSAALAVLLRRHGQRAELVIGAQLVPFHSHAWVEVGNQVVNDKPYIGATFQVLERC